MPTLTADQVKPLDPYAFLAVLGKRVIHPGGRASTDRLLVWAGVKPEERVLDVGCGVGTTAIRIANECGAQVTAADVAPLMRERADQNVRSAGVTELVDVEDADILALPYPDNSFDVVIAEAVTMFVDRSRAAAELARVCRHGGRVLATEFFWLRPPTPEAKEIFLGEVCPVLRFDSIDEWIEIYRGAGLGNVRTDSVSFDMMTARLPGRRGGTRCSCRRARHVPPGVRSQDDLAGARMARAVPYLGYLLVMATKPVEPAA